MAGEKICIICGVDCAERPRMKDSQGRYACQDCIKAGRKAPAAETKSPKGSTPARPAAGRASAGFDMDSYLEGVHTADANPCPKCGNGRPAGAIVCMQCGYDSEAGRAITTRVSKEKASRTRGARRAPRVSGGTVFVVVILAMLALLPLMAFSSQEAATFAAVLAAIWTFVAYIMMVVSAFRDDDRFWGIIGALFWIPLAGGLCALSFVLYYCTIGGQRGTWKLNYWAAVLSSVIIVALIASKYPELLSTGGPADVP